ncbi:MAG TPA: YicC/YloC family endoribonuclease [Opitutales bacterium]|nr:YicC/YloC family endoribonuclease [Opitutales bacterium]
MTGYGAGAASLAGREIFAEISSVNRKGLEINVALPREWNALEGPVGERVKGRLSRGAVRLAIAVRAPGAATPVVKWDEAAVQKEFAQLRELAERFEIPFNPDVSLLLRLAQATNGEPPLPSADEARAAVEKAVAAALEQLVAARSREGAALKADLTARVQTLQKLAAEIAPLAPASVTRYREALLARLKQIGLEIDLNDERVLREIALFADRCDITEELTRLASHFAQFEKILADDAPAGRKLDFLCQEIHREFNTVGSKAQHLDITRRVLDAKNELERIREQVQNVE